MKRALWAGLSLIVIAAACPPSQAATGDRIAVVGSSTVYPFSTLVAQHFAKSGPFPEPDVRATSTAEGFRLFCAGAGADTPDVSNASRPISDGEREMCAHNGVQKIAEIRIGYDSLILASSVRSPGFDVTLDQLWRASAELVPVGDRLVPNPYRTWHDVDPALPSRQINLIGPASGHGTRDTFIELVMEPSCRAALSKVQRVSAKDQSYCSSIRKDGRWTDVENLELILGKLAQNPAATGILTYSYLEQFSNRIRAMTVNHIVPSRATIPPGTYPLSRPLFIYLKTGHLKTTTGLADYAGEFLSLCAAGVHGYLADEGLVPLLPRELLSQRAAVARLQQ